MMNLKGADMS